MQVNLDRYAVITSPVRNAVRKDLPFRLGDENLPARLRQRRVRDSGTRRRRTSPASPSGACSASNVRVALDGVRARTSDGAGGLVRREHARIARQHERPLTSGSIGDFEAARPVQSDAVRIGLRPVILNRRLRAHTACRRSASACAAEPLVPVRRSVTFRSPTIAGSADRCGSVRAATGGSPGSDASPPIRRTPGSHTEESNRREQIALATATTSRPAAGESGRHVRLRPSRHPGRSGAAQ